MWIHKEAQKEACRLLMEIKYYGTFMTIQLHNVLKRGKISIFGRTMHHLRK